MAASVKDWLKSLNLERYLTRMEESGFDTLKKCALITSSDLDKIGVQLPGHQQRILKNLPAIDVCGMMEDALSSSSEDVYVNVEASQKLLSNKPDAGKDDDSEPIPGSKTPCHAQSKRPVPQPRKSLQKKDITVERNIAELSNLSENEPTMISSSLDKKTPKSESELITKPVPEPRRKHFLKITGVTESETDLTCISNSNTDDESSSRVMDSCSEPNYSLTQMSDSEHKPEEEGLVKQEFTQEQRRVDDDDQSFTEMRDASDTNVDLLCSPAPVGLRPEDLDILENWQGTTETKTRELDKMFTTKADMGKSPDDMFDSEASLNFEPKLDNKNMFDTGVIIPQSVDEWDKVTVTESLEPEKSPYPNTGTKPVFPAGDVNVTQPAVSEEELHSERCGVFADFDRDLNDIRDVPNRNTHTVFVSEEQENIQNETLCANAKIKDSPGSPFLTYMPIWKMESSNIKNQEPDEASDYEYMAPPNFSPPPLPPETHAQKKPDSDSADNKPKLPVRKGLVAPHMIPKKDAPVHIPSSERGKIPSATPGMKCSVGLPQGQHSSGTNEMSQFQQNSKLAASAHTDTHVTGLLKRNDRALPPLPFDATERMTPWRAAPQLPSQQSSQDKGSSVSTPTSSNRESFTDLARNRLGFNVPHSPHLQSVEEKSNIPQGATVLPLKPASKPSIPNLHKVANVTNEPTEYEYVAASPLVYDELQSDDTLSDGGEWCDTFNVPPKKASISSTPTVQNKTAKKSGNLFKKTYREAIPRMGAVWTRRWVTLDEKYLKYCSLRKHSVTKRIIPVESILNVEQSVKLGDPHPYQFRLITVDRIYTFATDNSDDLSVWCNMIMFAVMHCKCEFIEGGEMNTPDKEGFIKMENVRNKRYFALKGDKLCYYNTLKDFKAGTPVAQIDMRITAIKELSKNKLQLLTSTDSVTLILDTADELNTWKTAFEEAIAEGLGEDSVLNEVYDNHSNRFCADCQASGPQWASVNLGITLCKRCAGVHRQLTLPVSKIRSLRMDCTVWKPSLIKVLQNIGNDNANIFWQWHLRQDDHLDADADMSAREEHIILKYRSKQFCKLHPLRGDQQALNEALLKAVQFNDVLETMQLLFTGADILTHGPDGQTPLQLAKKANQELQVEFLCQNGAEGSGQMPVTTSMVEEHINAEISVFITHKGYLYKTGSNVKEDFLKRWCVLSDGCLSYYENEKSATPKNKIAVKEMMSVTLTSDPRFEFTFELATLRHGRVFLFAADLEEDRKKWVTVIAKTLAPVPREFLVNIRDFSRAGLVYLKRGPTDMWYKSWLQMKDGLLFYFVQANWPKTSQHITMSDEQFQKIDLRKIKNINLVSSSPETCVVASEEGPVIVLTLYKDSSRSYASLYIQGDISKETDAWYNVIQRAAKKSGSKVDEQALTDEDIPVIVDKCINFVTLHGMKTCGIYRLSGQHSKVTKLLECFQKDAREFVLRLEEYNVHDVATALKRFFRSLGEPLLVQSLYPKWLNTASIHEKGMKLQWYQYLVRELPTVNYCTLKKLISHLCHVAEQANENKMSSTNIASIFGPIVLSVDKSEDSPVGYKATSQEIAVFRDLMEAYVSVFEVNDRELEHESKIQEAQKKMEEAMKRSSEMMKAIPQEMLLPVYVNNKEGPVFTLQVTASTTARELLNEIDQRCSLEDNKHSAIFECICSGELERPLNDEEKVLSVTLRWADWPLELCKDNILCVKDNYIQKNTEVIIDPHTALFSELKYSEKKGFKKYCFEFSHMQMSYKKDARSTSSHCSWNVEDLTVYVGVQQKRNPPTLYGFSFVKYDETVHGPLFGHSLCCNTFEELYRWLAAIFHAQKLSSARRSIGSSSGVLGSKDSRGRVVDVSLAPIEADLLSPPKSSNRLKNFIRNKLIHK